MTDLFSDIRVRVYSATSSDEAIDKLGEDLESALFDRLVVLADQVQTDLRAAGWSDLRIEVSD